MLKLIPFDFRRVLRSKKLAVLNWLLNVLFFISFPADGLVDEPSK